MPSWLDNFMAHKPLLSRVVGRFVRPDDIEDIVQETFLHSFAASRRQSIDNPRAFMVTTARNIALNYLNRSDRKLNLSTEDLPEQLWEEATETLEGQYQSEERFHAFCQSVAALPAQCRKVFVLKKVYGLSQREIASELGLSESTVEKHVARGLMLTAEALSAQGHLPARRRGRQVKERVCP